MPSTLSSIAPSTTVISDKVFTLQYVLQQPREKGGLSSGAKAGIGVGVVAACLLIIIPLVLALLRRSRGGPPSEPEPPLKRINIHPTILEMGSTPSLVPEGNRAGEFDAAWVGELADLEVKLPDTRRASDQELLLEFELKGQSPPAYLKG
jgi:tetrahydromethanopterin S-methyltransferase subunit F